MGWPRAHAQRPGVYAHAGLQARRIGGGLERNQCIFGCRGRRTGSGADCAEDSLALRKLGLTRILLRHLGVAYDTECDQHHEGRAVVPA